jgi:hypothetical protein
MTAQRDATDLDTFYTSSDEMSLSDSDEDWANNKALRPGIHPIGISKNYVPRWTCADAFRELYQNWSV